MYHVWPRPQKKVEQMIHRDFPYMMIIPVLVYLTARIPLSAVSEQVPATTCGSLSGLQDRSCMYIYPAFNILEALYLVPNAQLVSAHIPRRAASVRLPDFIHTRMSYEVTSLL